MVCCDKCGLRYTEHAPTPAELAEVYSLAYRPNGTYKRHLDELAKDEGQGFYRKRVFLNRYTPNSGDKLLEIGCGVGSFLLAARNRGWFVDGIDISPNAVTAATEQRNLPVHLGTIETVDLRPHSYRAIVAWEVLEHLVDPRAFLAHLQELLTPDGFFVCSVPNSSAKVPLKRLSAAASTPPMHLNFWTAESFKNFAEINGFAVTKLFIRKSLFAKARINFKRFFWHQMRILAGLAEGHTIFAVIAPSP